MKKGDLVFVDFPFTDLSGKKRRPALVLALDMVDATLAFVTSQLQQAQTVDVMLTPNPQNGLKVLSAIRVGKLATLKQSLIQGKLGEVTSTELAQVDAGLRKVFQL